MSISTRRRVHIMYHPTVTICEILYLFTLLTIVLVSANRCCFNSRIVPAVTRVPHSLSATAKRLTRGLPRASLCNAQIKFYSSELLEKSKFWIACGGFVQARDIHHCSVLAQEVVWIMSIHTVYNVLPHDEWLDHQRGPSQNEIPLKIAGTEFELKYSDIMSQYSLTECARQVVLIFARLVL